MKRAINITVVVLALVFLMEVGSGWAEEYEKVLVPTKTGEWMELTLVPEEYVVNYARTLLSGFHMNQGKTFRDEYLLVPIYGLEDQIMAYFVGFHTGDLVAKDMNELYEQQKRENLDFVKAIEAYCDGTSDYSSYCNSVRENLAEFYMNEHYVSGFFNCFFELPTFGYPVDGVPMPFYWMAESYLSSIYHVEPSFKCFRFTEEFGFCFEFEIAGDIFLIALDPYLENVKVLKKEECNTFSGTTNKYDPTKIEDNKEKWEKYSF